MIEDFIRRHVKDILKFMLSVAVIFVIMCIATYIHELSHATMTEMCGGETVYMKVFLLEGKTGTKGLDTSSKRIVCVAGGIGAVLFGALIVVMGHNFNNETICIGGYLVIMREILNWIVSPIYKRGDFYILMQTHDNINIEPIITILWVFLILAFIMLVSSLCKIDSNKKIKKWLF